MHEDAHTGREQVQYVARIRTALHNRLWTAHLLVRMKRLDVAHQEMRGPALIGRDLGNAVVEHDRLALDKLRPE